MNRPSLHRIGDAAMTAIVYALAIVLCVPVLVLRALARDAREGATMREPRKRRSPASANAGLQGRTQHSFGSHPTTAVCSFVMVMHSLLAGGAHAR